MIVSVELNNEQNKKLLRILKKHKKALGWTILDLKGISSPYMHHILIEENCKPVIEMQRRLNPNMKEWQKKMKWLGESIVYPIFLIVSGLVLFMLFQRKV